MLFDSLQFRQVICLHDRGQSMNQQPLLSPPSPHRRGLISCDWLSISRFSQAWDRKFGVYMILSKKALNLHRSCESELSSSFRRKESLPSAACLNSRRVSKPKTNYRDLMSQRCGDENKRGWMRETRSCCQLRSLPLSVFLCLFISSEFKSAAVDFNRFLLFLFCL